MYSFNWSHNNDVQIYSSLFKAIKALRIPCVCACACVCVTSPHTWLPRWRLDLWNHPIRHGATVRGPCSLDPGVPAALPAPPAVWLLRDFCTVLPFDRTKISECIALRSRRRPRIVTVWRSHNNRAAEVQREPGTKALLLWGVCIIERWGCCASRVVLSVSIRLKVRVGLRGRIFVCLSSVLQVFSLFLQNTTPPTTPTEIFIILRVPCCTSLVLFIRHLYNTHTRTHARTCTCVRVFSYVCCRDVK